MILASKNGITKQFSPYAWQMLGKDKSGWVEAEALTTEGVKTEKPSTGQAKVEKPKRQSTEGVKTSPAKVETTTGIDEFTKLVEENVSATKIKDYFDYADVKYSNASTDAELNAQLKEQLAGDIAKLKEIFGL